MNGHTDKPGINQDKKAIGTTAILEGEYAKAPQQGKGAVQTEAVPENPACEEDGILIEKPSTSTGTPAEEPLSQRDARRQHAAEWVALGVLAVGLIALSAYAFHLFWHLHKIAMNMYGFWF